MEELQEQQELYVQEPEHDIEAPVTYDAQEPYAPEPVAQEPQEESFQAKNFKELRKKALEMQRERDEYAKRVAEYEAHIASLSGNKQQEYPQEEDEDISLAPDELAEGKHLSKVGRKIKRLEEQLKTYQQSAHESAIETRIKTQFPDFDAIVNKENIEALRLMEPSLAQTINTTPDLYHKAVSTYTLIKKLGIAVDGQYDADKQRALKNAAKPRALASVSPQQGESPLQRANAFANGLTEELKAQLLKEMIAARKSL